MTNKSKTATQELPDADATPILFHDGCKLCLDIAKTLLSAVPGLTVIDLSKLPQFKKEAIERGVFRLPSLVIGEKVLPVSPHSDTDQVH